MTHDRRFRSGVIGWFAELYRRVSRQVLIFAVVAAALFGYAYSRGWIEVRFNYAELAEETGPIRHDDEFTGTGLGATGRGRAYGIFVSLSQFPPDEHGASRNLPGHARLAQRVADAFIGTHIMRREDAIVLMDEAATLERFHEAVIRQSLAIDEEDLVILFFATHGGDNQLEMRDGAMLTETVLQGNLARLRGAQGLFIADACHSGSLANARPMVGTVPWNHLFSTGETTFSYGEFLSNSLIDVLPLLGADDGRVTLGDLVAAVQDRVRATTGLLPDSQRDQMWVNAAGDRDAMLWHANSLPIASDE